MNGKQLFEMLDGLDEDIVENAWTGEDGITQKFEPELKKHTTPLFWKIAASAAACAVIVSAGIYALTKQDTTGIDIVFPNSSVSSELTAKPEQVPQTEQRENFNIDPFTPTENLIDINGDLSNYKAKPSVAEKTDNYDYAAVYIDETNADENDPVYLCIYGYGGENPEEAECVSETVKITGAGVYVISYSRLWGAGTFNILTVDTENEDLIFKGKWLP